MRTASSAIASFPRPALRRADETGGPADKPAGTRSPHARRCAGLMKLKAVVAELDRTPFSPRPHRAGPMKHAPCTSRRSFLDAFSRPAPAGPMKLRNAQRALVSVGSPRPARSRANEPQETPPIETDRGDSLHARRCAGLMKRQATRSISTTTWTFHARRCARQMKPSGPIGSSSFFTSFPRPALRRANETVLLAPRLGQPHTDFPCPALRRADETLARASDHARRVCSPRPAQRRADETSDASESGSTSNCLHARRNAGLMKLVWPVTAGETDHGAFHARRCAGLMKPNGPEDGLASYLLSIPGFAPG